MNWVVGGGVFVVGGLVGVVGVLVLDEDVG